MSIRCQAGDSIRTSPSVGRYLHIPTGSSSAERRLKPRTGRARHSTKSSLPCLGRSHSGRIRFQPAARPARSGGAAQGITVDRSSSDRCRVGRADVRREYRRRLAHANGHPGRHARRTDPNRKPAGQSRSAPVAHRLSRRALVGRRAASPPAAPCCRHWGMAEQRRDIRAGPRLLPRYRVRAYSAGSWR